MPRKKNEEKKLEEKKVKETKSEKKAGEAVEKNKKELVNEEKVKETVKKVEKNLEKSAEKVEKIVDELVDEKVEKVLGVEKVLSNPKVKKLIESKKVEKAVKSISKYHKTVWKVLGILALVGGVVSLIEAVILLLGPLWAGVLGGFVRSLLLLLVFVVGGALSFTLGLKLLKGSKKAVNYALLLLGVSVVYFIASLFPAGYVLTFGGYVKPVHYGVVSSLISIILNVVIVVYLYHSSKK